MIPSGDTWGISGPTFLLAYLVLAARGRRGRPPYPARARRRVRRAAGEPDGGAPLRRGVPQRRRAARGHRCAERDVPGRDDQHGWTGRRRRGGQRPESRADELERAIHHAAATGPVSRHALPRSADVASALHRVEQRLIAAGLLLAAERRQRIRLAGGWVLAWPCSVSSGSWRAREQPSGRLPDHPGRAGHAFSGCCSPAPPRAGRGRATRCCGGWRPNTTRCRRRCVPTGRTTARRALRSRWASSGWARCGPRTRRSPPNWPRSGRRPGRSGSLSAATRAADPAPAAAAGGGGCGGGGAGLAAAGRGGCGRPRRRTPAARRDERGVAARRAPRTAQGAAPRWRDRDRLAPGHRRRRRRPSRTAVLRGDRGIAGGRGPRPVALPRGVAELRGRGVAAVPHGVRLSLGGAEPLDPVRVTHLAACAAALDAPLVSEHVAFVRAGGREAGHLLPLPRSRAALDV